MLEIGETMPRSPLRQVRLKHCELVVTVKTLDRRRSTMELTELKRETTLLSERLGKAQDYL